MFIEEKNRIFLRDEKGNDIAEVNLVENEDNIEIRRVFVDESLRGQKIASKLVFEVVQKARRENKKIVPICSYAVKEFETKEEYKDLL